MKICSKGVWDSSIPDIKFDQSGVSNYYKNFLKIDKEFPIGNEGKKRWDNFLIEIKKKGKGKKYNCIIGLSGGVDSSYLLHLAVKEWGLRPLAFNLDNGWSSKIAVSNIKSLTNDLGVDLETYVINYEEVKIALRSYMKASLPWVDGATDRAIKSSIYRTAYKEGINSILVGTDFRSEGRQPNEWTHNDAKLFSYILKKFSNNKLKTYPNMGLIEQLFYGSICKIKKYQPFYNLNYSKQDAKKFLIKNYNWIDYGGHHHENLFTKFIISYWLKKKFNIDKRIITYSAQIISNKMKREVALKKLKEPPYDINEMERDKITVLNKLGFSMSEFDEVFNLKNKTFKDYPSHFDLLNNNKKFINKYYYLFMPNKPKMIIE
tara:strand:- start:12763 stop:13890 length:1128 start_codon:yes stop_codon:yes gene_type:complete